MGAGLTMSLIKKIHDMDQDSEPSASQVRIVLGVAPGTLLSGQIIPPGMWPLPVDTNGDYVINLTDVQYPLQRAEQGATYRIPKHHPHMQVDVSHHGELPELDDGVVPPPGPGRQVRISVGPSQTLHAVGTLITPQQFFQINEHDGSWPANAITGNNRWYDPNADSDGGLDAFYYLKDAFFAANASPVLPGDSPGNVQIRVKDINCCGNRW